MKIMWMATSYALIAACGDDETELSRVARALGGLPAIRATTTQSITASGDRYDQHECFSPVPGERDDTTVAMHYASTVALDFGLRGQTATWDGVTVEVIPGTHPHWMETSQGDFGFTTGTLSGYPPTDPAPMTSLQVAARWKELAMQSPIALVKYALEHPADVSERDHVITIDAAWGWPQPVHLVIDPETHLPISADTLEDDPVRGDARYEVAFEDWGHAGTVGAPFRITGSLNGSRVVEEERSDVTTNPAIDTSVPPAFQVNYNADAAAWGARSSQYFLRFQAFAFPLYFDQSIAIPPYIPGLSAAIVDATPGARIIQYRISFYNTMVVELPSSLVVVEAPLYESASAAVIADIANRFPNKPVTAIVSTHFHFDHTGGIRRYLAEWPAATLYVPEEVVDFYAELARAPHTIVPDKLASTTWTGSIRGVAAPSGGASVGEPIVLAAPGGHTIRLFDMVVDHSKGTVIPIVDDAQVLFVTDLYNPTSDGRGGPLSDGRDRYAHDLYARQLYTNLATIGYTPTLQPALRFVGGHGAVGSWGELCVWGNGFGPSGRPPPGQPIDPSKVCPP